MINLDQNATTAIDPEVFEAVSEALRRFPGNPSSVHGEGRAARGALEQARADLAGSVDGDAEGVIFTGSGSEANNLMIQGVVAARAGRPSHLVVSAIEHDSVLHAARAMARRFASVAVTEVAPESDGAARPAAMAAALRPETCLVCLMHANNETGCLQPVAETARLAHGAGALLHCDAVQSPGRARLEMRALGCDSLTLSAHKFQGPKGIGALLVGPAVKLEPMIHGGSQERLRRAGTENVAGAIGMALAARLARERRPAATAHLRGLEEAFLEALRRDQPDLEINGVFDDKIPGVVNLSIRGVHQDDLVVGMDLAGYAISAGAACSSGVIEPSHVLTAMGLERWRIEGGVRISFGREHTPRQAADAGAALGRLSRRLQAARASEEAI
jgi:cysteine desulfurase